MVSSIFNICSCFLYFTELTWLQNKIETTLYTAVSIDIDAYYWDTQGVATFFHGVKCPGYRDLKKGQIPAHSGLSSCQMPGGCPGGGGMGTLGFDSYIRFENCYRVTCLSTYTRCAVTQLVAILRDGPFDFRGGGGEGGRFEEKHFLHSLYKETLASEKNSSIPPPRQKVKCSTPKGWFWIDCEIYIFKQF